MNMRKTVLGSALAVALAGGGGLAWAEKSIDIEIGTAPPAAVVVERERPAPRVGYIYEPGHYAVENERYVWREPQYIREREGHRYTPYVLEKHGDRWHYRGGHWDDD